MNQERLFLDTVFIQALLNRERIYVYYSINIIINYSQKIYKLQSCTSLNPGYPDSDNHNNTLSRTCNLFIILSSKR